jgi:hypothetical protein
MHPMGRGLVIAFSLWVSAFVHSPSVGDSVATAGGQLGAAVAVGFRTAVLACVGSPAPWYDAEPCLPVYGTLIDVGCVLLLWRLTRREGIGLLDLVGFQRSRLFRDVLLGLRSSR